MPMKKSLFPALLCAIFAFVLPWKTAEAVSDRENASPAPSGIVCPTPTASADSVPSPAPSGTSPTPSPSRDEALTLTVKTEDGILSLTMAEYLPGVLAGEMPPDFAPEALRAQAVAARTYALCEAARDKPDHPDSDVCASPGCCQVWKSEEQLRSLWGEAYERTMALFTAAVRDTDGMILLWEDEPALSCFHASSGGSTEDSAAVWGRAVPYLVAVDSPETAETVSDLLSEAVFSPEEFSALLLSAYPECDLSGAPGGWVKDTAWDDSGRVASCTVGGVTLSGVELRKLFSLRSAAFSLAWTGTEFRFSVIGSGHGVGMSQHGADLMARSGSTWQEILAHYYPGTTLGKISTT